MSSHQPTRGPYEAERRALAERGARTISWCAIGLLPLFAYTDTIMFAAHEPLFFFGRLVCIGMAITVLLALRTAFGRMHALLLAAAMPVTVGLDVVAMTLVAGRETSPYYAGVIVVLLAASLLLPWPPLWALVVSALLVGSYAIGIVASGPVVHVPVFMTNVFLLFSTGVLVVVGATLSERLREREFESRTRLAAHARRKEAIATLGQLALSAVGSARLMECAVALVAEALEVTYCGVVELRADGSRPHLRAGIGWDLATTERARADCGPGSHALHIVTAPGPVVFDDLARETRFTPAPLLVDHGVVSGMSVKIAGRDRPFGILGAHSTSARRFTAQEITFLEAVAGVLTTAILREQAEAVLNEEMHTSRALARVGQELISSLETPVLLDRLCESTAEVLGADYSNTWLWKPDAQVYTARCSHGMAPEHWEALRAMPVPSAAIAPLIAGLDRDGIVYLTPESRDAPAVITNLMARHSATLAVYIAFRRGDEIIGVQVSGYHGRTRPFTAQEERLARGIAQLASMALTNAELVEELERASRLKSEFVSTMSHELRTPLNVIIGYTDMLGDVHEDDERALMLAQVRKSSLELLEMVEATLTLNRIAAGKDLPQLEAVDVAGLWQELEADFTALMRTPGAALRFEAIGAVELWTDRRKLKIILKNLIGNALKFTPTGEVVANCVPRGDRCTFTVRDTGIGIPEAHLPHIFEMFRQVDSSDARSYGGAGLGLYIVSRLVGQLGGEIEVASRPGEGSTFTVTLPRRPGEHTAASDWQPERSVRVSAG